MPRRALRPPQPRRRDLLALAGVALLSPQLARAEPIRIRDLWKRREGYTELARAHKGERVTVAGFMAPPLKAASRFFVLTQRPSAVCPFCDDEALWPEDILAVYAKRVVDVTPYNVPIETTGVLRLDGHTDPETGFVSRLRLEDAVYARS